MNDLSRSLLELEFDAGTFYLTGLDMHVRQSSSSQTARVNNRRNQRCAAGETIAKLKMQMEEHHAIEIQLVESSKHRLQTEVYSIKPAEVLDLLPARLNPRR